MFRDANKFNQPLNSFDVSNVKDFSYMFASDIFDDNDSFDMPIGSWNTSSAETMRAMFRGASKFNQNLNSWDVSNVTDMEYMFSRTDMFNGFIGNWDTSNVIDMSAMFQAAISFNQPIGSWNISNVTDLNTMFQNTPLFNQPIGSWDTSKVTRMGAMFWGADSFNQDVASWDISNVIDTHWMFKSTPSFNQIFCWNLSDEVNTEDMFLNSNATFCSEQVDTDGDGFSDADEATLGTDPNDPTSPLENKLTASDAAQYDYFGHSVSIDGDTAVIGAYADDDNGSSSGSAYVYVRSNGVWSEQQKLTAIDGIEGDKFGYSVSIDDDTIVIGAYGDGTSSGSAYIFIRSNGLWSQQAKLTASDGASDDQFGWSVSIDGDTAVISSRRSGSAYVYVRNNGVWSEQQVLTASGGTSVSIDGNTIVGLWGSAYVYVRNNGVWSEQQVLTVSGSSVSIDGNIIVIGDPSDDEDSNLDDNRGSAYVFTRSNGVWSEQQKLLASNPSMFAYFGTSVSIDDDKIAIGADSGGCGCYPGSVHVFVRSNDVWSQQVRLTASDGGASVNAFGGSVSIDGDKVLIGATGWDQNGSVSGSAYVFDTFVDTPAIIAGDTSKSLQQGGATTGTLTATDVDGLTDGSYFTISTPPVHGQAIINPFSGAWVYLGSSTYAGLDPFTVTVTDDLAGTTEQIINIMVTGTDTDGDTIYDPSDNCPNTANTNQSDIDNDQLGDACDPDIDGDGINNTLDAFPNDPTESSDSDSDNVGDNTDNCVNAANFNQANLDGDGLGDVCDPDMDGDGYTNAFEVRFGGDETDNTDAAVSLANAMAFSETAPADSDLDGVPDDYETAAGGDATSSTFESVLAMLTTAKNVPAMGGIGLLALGLSMLCLGVVRLRRQ